MLEKVVENGGMFYPSSVSIQPHNKAMLSKEPEMEWNRTYDEGGIDFAHSLAVDSYDNIIVTGASTLGGNFDNCTINIIVRVMNPGIGSMKEAT